MTSTRTPARPGWRPGFSRAGSWYLLGAVSLTVLWLLVRSLAPANGLTRSYYYPLGGSTLPVVAERITAVDLAFIDEQGQPARNYQVRWEGVWFSPRAERIDFFAGADDGVVVRVDGEIVLERNPAVGMHFTSGAVRLGAGAHRFEIDHWQRGGGRALRVAWAPAGGGAEPLDPGRLFPENPGAPGYWLAAAALRLPLLVLFAWAAGPLASFARRVCGEVAVLPAGEARTRFRFHELHVAGLWAVAVAQPLFDLLSRSPEFFVAHGTRPGDLLGLVLLLCLAGPVCWMPAVRLGGRIGPRPHALAVSLAVGTLAAALALLAVKQTFGWSRDLSFGVAAACGMLAGGGYVLSSTVRLFATFLSPAALVVPAVFLLHPAISPFLSADDEGPLDGVAFDATPPIVVAVFDQLPLVSLLDRDGRIDRTAYPAFAALADDATWFRNASSVSGWTQYALPAIVTGNYPAPGRLPTAADHPGNLFTLFGSRYDLHVLEPLTRLCPETLCKRDRPGPGAWFAATSSDLAVVYLQAVLPDDLTASLPPVTQNWRDFVVEDTFIGRWNARRVQDRGRTVEDFIASIAAGGPGDRAVLHFLHVLLPHEPWFYLPTGQRHTLRRYTVGTAGGRWSDDARVVASSYQRHLLQSQYVDGLLGKLMKRLRRVGIYDEALVVVAADHGASLRAGLPFRNTGAATFADVASVPLFIKRPGQREGRVTDANVETIDILPTLAAQAGVRLPWDAAGSDAFAERPKPRTTKTMFIHGARDSMAGPADLSDAIAAGVARKFEIFEAGDPLKLRLAAYHELVGAPAAAMRSDRPAGFEVVVDTIPLLNAVDHGSDFVPAHVTGGVVTPGTRIAPPLAVVLNGVVAAVTRPYHFPAYGHAVPWEAVVDPRLIEQGANTVQVFAIRDTPDGTVALDAARIVE